MNTIQSLSDFENLLNLGDVVYLPNQQISASDYTKLQNCLNRQAWFLRMATDFGLPFPLQNWREAELALSVLGNIGRGWKSDNRLEQLPKFARIYIRSFEAIAEIDPIAVVPGFPFMELGYIIKDDGPVKDAFKVFRLDRLQRIRQLAFLHDPVVREVDIGAGTMIFGHTRYLHSLDVYAVCHLLAKNCDLPKMAYMALVTAGLGHDAMTPAGGDTTKSIDLVALNEEVQFARLLRGEDWDNFHRIWKVDGKLLLNTVNGVGILGLLLDLADKSSYVARDANALLGSHRGRLLRGCQEISALLQMHPFVCKLWDVVQIRGERVVITDAERLGNFLKLRALLFKHLYYNPYSRFFEYLIGAGVIKHLYQSGLITLEDLLTKDDAWLERQIDAFFGTSLILSSLHNLEHARIEEYPDHETACRRASEFDSDPGVLVIVDNFQYLSGSGTRKFFVNQRGRNVVFADACPEAAREIDEIMTFPKVTRLYFFDCNDLEISLLSRSSVKKVLCQARN